MSCSELPDELMRMVLHKVADGDTQAVLANLRLASRRWQAVVDSSVTSHVLSFNSLPALQWQGDLLQRLFNLTELHADLQAGLMDTCSHAIMLSSIVHAATQLESLHVALRLVRDLPLIADTSEMNADLPAQLRALTGLHTLSLKSDGRVPAGIEVLTAAVQNLRGLRVLRVKFAMGNAGIEGLAAHLWDNQAICTLDLQGTAIGDEGARMLAAGLARNSTLRELNLSHNTLGAAGAEAVAEAVTGNAALESLRLDFNIIVDGTEMLGRALMSNCSLKVLSLQSNGIGPRGMAHIAGGLATNTSLVELDLAGNAMQEEGAFMLGGIFASNTSLTKLSLSDCKLHDEGVRAMLRQSRGACSLQSLELQRNHVTAHGVGAVAAFLGGAPRGGGCVRGGSRIAHLDLSHNSLGDLGISLLSESLCEAAALRSLILQDCDIGVAGAEAIAMCLQCMSLECLNVNRNSVADAGACALGLAAQKQCTLRELHAASNCINERGSLAITVALKSVPSMRCGVEALLGYGCDGGKYKDSYAMKPAHELCKLRGAML